MDSVSGCVPGGAVEDLALSDSLEIMLGNSSGCCLIVGLEVVAYDEVGVTVGAVLLGGVELPLLATSSEEVWTSGCVESWKLEASCGCTGDTGVEGSEDQD